MSDINKHAENEQLVAQSDGEADTDTHKNQEGGTLSRNLSTPGRILRAARENKELAISTVGKQLKLDTRVIEALERDDYDSIGAPVFVKGHLRKYASFVDVNPDDVMLSYYQVARAQDTTPIISQTMPMTDSRPKFAWLGKLVTGLVVFGLIAALLYGVYRGWNWYLADAESTANDSVAAITDANLSLPSRDDVQISNTNTNSSNSNSATVQADSAQTLSLPPQNTTTPTTVVNTNAFVNGAEGDDSNVRNLEPETIEMSSDAVNTESSGTDTLSSSATAGDSLRLVFVENSWVNIKDNNERSLMNGIGYQGDSREFTLKGNTEIHLGNSDGVELFLNGKPYTVPSRARRGKTAHFELVPRQ